MSLFNASEAALRPPGFDPALEPGLSGAEANCLTCHQVNGFDGGKVKADLALVARAMPAAEFVKWTLEPSSVKPDTTMPALSTNLAKAQRRAIARRGNNGVRRTVGMGGLRAFPGRRCGPGLRPTGASKVATCHVPSAEDPMRGGQRPRSDILVC